MASREASRPVTGPARRWRVPGIALVAALTLAGALGGCEDPQTARLAAIRDKVCACETASCARAALAGVPRENVHATHRAQVIARGMLDCLARLEEAEAAPPDGGGGTPPPPPTQTTAAGAP